MTRGLLVSTVPIGPELGSHYVQLCDLPILCLDISSKFLRHEDSIAKMDSRKQLQSSKTLGELGLPYNSQGTLEHFVSNLNDKALAPAVAENGALKAWSN